MAARLPTDLSGRQVRAALERAGFEFRRQSGSHMILRRGAPYARVVVPDHQQVRQGTLRRIVADVGLTVYRAVAPVMLQGRPSVCYSCAAAELRVGPGASRPPPFPVTRVPV
jgi:predicted RNA binding protein YcfA (HicA-like mRNA interferase family)